MKKIALLIFIALPLLAITKTVTVNNTETIKKYYDDGSLLSEIEYKDGKRNGKCIHYWKNGNLWGSGTYNMGIQDGEWKTYFEDGTLKNVSHYDNGKFTGESKTYNADGILTMKATYDDDGTGTWEFYDKDGNITDTGENEGGC